VEFKLNSYVNFVAELLESGYECLPFSSPKARSLTGKNLLLRHDVDMDPSVAVIMAAAEARVGAKSTYFILLSNRHTNPLDKEFRVAVQEINKLGHWVGLHFDASQYDLTSSSPDFASRVHYEASLLTTLTGVEVDSVSFHRPSRDLINSPHELTAPLSHTYEQSFIEQMEYCSDSSGQWAYGPPEERSAHKLGQPFHLLTHPIWWGNDDAEPLARIKKWMQVRIETDFSYEVPNVQNPFAVPT
jgi:hypothetical protein